MVGIKETYVPELYSLVKCRFLDEEGEPKGREYTYAANETFAVGEIVCTDEGKKIVITDTDVSQEEIRDFGDKLKYISRGESEPEITMGFETETDDIIISEDSSESSHELIVIEQLPVIKERLILLSTEISRRTSAALAMDCTEETVKAVKNLRAELNKESSYWDEQRKKVKAAVMSPYEQFEVIFKQCVSDPYKSTDAKLKAKIDAVEDEIKRQKYEEVKAYFEEYRASRKIDFVDMERWNPNVTLSASVKSLKTQAKEFIDRICDDLAMIETQEYRDEILVEYNHSLDASRSIVMVAARHKEIEAQKMKNAEYEAQKASEQASAKKVDEIMAQEVLSPPIEQTVNDDPVLTVTFKVSHNKSKLRELKQFLINGGYKLL